MIFLCNVLVRNLEFSYSISDISLNDGMPNPPRFDGRAYNLPFSMEHTTQPVKKSQNPFVTRSSIILIILLFDRTYMKQVNAACGLDFTI